MEKFLTIVFVVYIIYYAGNIVYDLFFKSESKIINSDDLEEFSVQDDNTEGVVSVKIDDVEDLKTPEREEEEEKVGGFEKDNEIEIDIDALRRRFEAEQEIEKWGDIPKKELLKQRRRERFKQMMKEAETCVQMVGNINGHKIYNSTRTN